MSKKRFIYVLICFVLSICLVSCGTQSDADNESTDSSEKTGALLTITAYDIDIPVEYKLEDIEALGTETHSYSGRNKENNNERQVREYTGIDLKKMLEAAGHEINDSDNIRITASDGYTSEFVLGEKYGLLFFDGEDATGGTEVPAMLAIIKDGESMGNDKKYNAEDGSPLRLVYGQADYDSATMKDFNMQGWASYVEKIEVTAPAG